MPWKRMSILAVTVAVLAACGGNQPAPVVSPDLGAGALSPGDDEPLPVESDAYGMDDPLASPDLSPVPSGGGLPSASPSAAAGFVLRGVVTDTADKPLAGARVSIGSQTTLTDAQGEFEFKGITETQLPVEVSKSGYDAILNFVVEFSNTRPTVDKIFMLAPLSASPSPSLSPGASPGPSASPQPSVAPTGLVHERMWESVRFAGVDAMVVTGGQAFVLGTLDKLLFDRKAVVVLDARSGEVMRRINDGLINRLPKAADSLDVVDNRVVVSDGTNRYTFDQDGKFIRKSSGASFGRLNEVRDGVNGITYTLKSGHKLDVKLDGKTASTFDLRDVGYGRVLGLDEDGGLLLLDDQKKAVHHYRFYR